MTSISGSEYVVVYVTAPVGEAPALARALVDARMVACVNIVPVVRSIYRWQDEICDDEESLLVIKTRRDRLSVLQQKVLELHPYEVPEVIALPIVGGHAPYLHWVDACITAGLEEGSGD